MENNTPNKLMYQSPTLRALRATTVTPRNSPFGTPNNGLQRRGNQLLQHVNYSTPNTRFPVIHNPFESALRDRLHLPLICSPSLFHRPSTPNQQASTQYEWTIEDVSFYNPAKVEVNDTQFTSVTDPAEDVQAQAAISSFFKHQLIVPSPIRCPLRKVKLPLSILNTDSAIKNGRKLINKRDASSQTELTLPSKLPKELEDLLKPYFTYTENQQQSPTQKKVPSNNCDTSIDHDARNASLRRKLFDTSLRSPSTNCDYSAVDIHAGLTIDSPIPKSPELKTSEDLKHFELDHSIVNNSLIDDKSSFGSISPISKTINQSKMNNSLSCTPTSSSFNNRSNRSCLNLSAIFQSTPERSSNSRTSNNNSKNTTISMAYQSCSSLITSPIPLKSENLILNEINYMSDDTINNSNSNNNNCRSNLTDKINDNQINDCDSNNSIDLSENEIDITRLNDQSFQMMNGSFNNSINYETPTRRRRKYRNESRKNLSHSFSSYKTNVPCGIEINCDSSAMDIMDYCLSTITTTPTNIDDYLKKTPNHITKNQLDFINNVNVTADIINKNDCEKGELITKADSGFNEM